MKLAIVSMRRSALVTSNMGRLLVPRRLSRPAFLIGATLARMFVVGPGRVKTRSVLFVGGVSGDPGGIVRLGAAVVLAEVGNRLVVGSKPARQPHHLNVAPSFTLQSPARLDPVEIAVDVELQQHRWMIRRPARYLGIDPAKPKFGQIEFLDKDIDHANRIVLADPVCHAFRKQRALPAIRPLNEALHLILPQIARESYPENQIQRCVFTQPGSLADKPSRAKVDLCPLLPQ